MASPNDTPPTSTGNEPVAEAAGAYRNPTAKSSSPLPWILGALALLAVILLALWFVGMFDDEDDDLDELERGETLPGARLVIPAEPVAFDAPRLLVA